VSGSRKGQGHKERPSRFRRGEERERERKDSDFEEAEERQRKKTRGWVVGRDVKCIGVYYYPLCTSQAQFGNIYK